MSESRRHVLQLISCAAAGLAAASAAPAVAQTPQPRPSPNAPTNPNAPAGLDSSEIIHPDKGPQANPELWTQVRLKSKKLLELATQLKNQVDQTDLAATLPLPIIEKAHEIEKLAKQIRQDAKG